MKAADNRNPIQVSFFEKLRNHVPQNVSLANDLADLLGLSQDGIYRRIRGESALGMDELITICRHYKLPPDLLAPPSENTATFQFRRIHQREEGLEDYLKSILNDLQRAKQAPNAHILYAAGDVPVFHHFLFPEITNFKIFYWQRAVMNVPSMDGKKYDPSETRRDFIELCNKIIREYVTVPSTEIWHPDTVVTNLTMLEYAWEAGWFSSRDQVLAIAQRFEEQMNYVERQAARSSKFISEEKWAGNEGNFKMYQSEVFLSNNHILVAAGPGKVAYLTHNSFNAMMTTNPVFVEETDAWLQILMKKSVLISGVAEKQRHQFFSKARAHVGRLVTRIRES